MDTHLPRLNARRAGRTYVIEARFCDDGYERPINLGVLKNVAPNMWYGDIVFSGVVLDFNAGPLRDVLAAIREKVDGVVLAARDEAYVPDEDGEIARERMMDAWAFEQSEIDRQGGGY